jgi:hypothetical protein
MLKSIREFSDDVLRVVGIWGIVSGVGGGVMLAAAKTYWPHIADSFTIRRDRVFPLSAWFVILRIGRRITTIETRVMHGSEITPDNIDTFVRNWADSFSLGMQRVPERDAPDTRFALMITLPNTSHALVFVPNQRPKYLVVQATIVPSEDHVRLMTALSPDDREMLNEKVRLELSRASQQFSIQGNFQSISVVKQLPIGLELSESTFIAAVDHVSVGQLLARDALVLGLKKAL